MKKLILTCLIAAGAISAVNAQGLKGKWYATSQIGYSQTKTGDAKQTYFNVLPIIGTFVSPDVTVGVAFGYINNKIENNDKGLLNSEVQAWAIEPLARKYWNIAGPLYFFGQVAVPVVFGKVKDTDIKVNQFGVGASAGFDVVVWNNVSFEFSYNIASLSFTTFDPGAGDKTTTTNFQLAHVANVQNGGAVPGVAPIGEQAGLLTPISVGIKFIF
jgi:opacity protein-like surface antigen